MHYAVHADIAVAEVQRRQRERVLTAQRCRRPFSYQWPHTKVSIASRAKAAYECRTAVPRLFLATWLSVVALATSAPAQVATATVRGTVIDESGAVVPDVRVAAVNVATGLQRTTSTGDQGTFAVPLLPPGVYKVTAERDGFRPTQITALVVRHH